MILFAAGFNMKRKEFFKNFVNILKFGIFGSLFTWFLFVFMFWALFELVDMGDTQAIMAVHNDIPEFETIKFKPSIYEIMVFCSILVSSDIIAAMSILKFDEQPHIFSIILGEGLCNDVVVLTLYQTTMTYLE
jgi:NhaP-type Na+/H+ or K+/H+ antiporter